MTYKKVTPISKGVLRIRSEPDESGRVCGSACDGIAAGMNVVIDSVTGKACEIGMTDGNIVVREA